MNIKGLTNHEAYLMKTLFMKAIKSRISEETLNECWAESGIMGRDKFEAFFVDKAIMNIVSLVEDQYAI